MRSKFPAWGDSPARVHHHSQLTRVWHLKSRIVVVSSQPPSIRSPRSDQTKPPIPKDVWSLSVPNQNVFTVAPSNRGAVPCANARLPTPVATKRLYGRSETPNRRTRSNWFSPVATKRLYGRSESPVRLLGLIGHLFP